MDTGFSTGYCSLVGRFSIKSSSMYSLQLPVLKNWCEMEVVIFLQP